MSIDRVGYGAGAQQALEKLAIARASAERAASPNGGGVSAAGTVRATGEADASVRAAIARIGARAANLQGLSAQATTVASALSESTSLLDEMHTILRDQASSASADRGTLDAARARLADIADSIAQAEAQASGETLPPVHRGFAILESDPRVKRIDGIAHLGAGETREIELQVLASATTAEVQLEFGGSSIHGDGSDGEFRIEIAGVLGSFELAFASGISTHQLVQLINQRTAQTGVSATLDSWDGRILLNAPQENDAFVSVRILADNGVLGQVHEPDTYRYVSFDQTDPDMVFSDDSSAWNVAINGEIAEVQGNTVLSTTSEWSLRLQLDDSIVGKGGTFHLMTLIGTGGPDFEHADTPPEFIAPIDGGLESIRSARDVATRAAEGSASSADVERVRDTVAERLAALRNLLTGPLADAGATADTRLAALLREAPKTGWSIDQRG